MRSNRFNVENVLNYSLILKSYNKQMSPILIVCSYYAMKCRVLMSDVPILKYVSMKNTFVTVFINL